MLTLDWAVEPQGIVCLVCGFIGVGVRCAEVRGAAQALIVGVRCAECESIMFDVAHPREYSNPDEVDEYVENKGSIEAIARNLGFVEPSEVTNFLDIGCNYGFGPHVGREVFGWNVVGIEPGVAGRRGASELGIEIRDELFDESTQFPSSFDFILASEVVEHVPDPLSLLRAVRSQVADGGRAVFTTPAAEAVAATESKTEALIAISPGDHVFLASAVGLEGLLSKAGWESFVVRRSGRSLTAIASTKPTELLLPDEVPAIDLTGYFDRQADIAPRGSALRAGMASRHFRALVNAGRFSEAARSAPRVVSAIRDEYGIDLSQMETAGFDLPHRDAVPLNTISYAYHSAMLRLGLDEGLVEAMRLFDLTIEAVDLRSVATNITDPDSADLRLNALRHRVLTAAKMGDPRLIGHVTALYEEDADAAVGWIRSAFEHLWELDLPTLAGALAHDSIGRDSVRVELLGSANEYYHSAVQQGSWSRAREIAAVVTELRPQRAGDVRRVVVSRLIAHPRVYRRIRDLLDHLPFRMRQLLSL